MTLWAQTAVGLRAMLEAGEATSVDIVQALHTRADQTEPTIHGFTRQRRRQALEEAAQLDAERAEGHIRGPLHGLPLTVKDNIQVEGLPTSIGLRHGSDRIAARDAVIVERAREGGAIVLGKSNVPQALVSMHCDNNLHGPTHNPWSPAHVTGGSSSGEGALIASGASVMGFGTDLGGSIRFPAAFCGVAGFKPTQDRWSNKGIESAMAGQAFVRPQVGPLARSCADLALLMAALPAHHQNALDWRVPPMSSQTPPSIEGMRIGWFEDDGFITPAPAMRRAVHQASEALRAAGAELVPFAPLHQEELVALYMGAVSSDGLSTLRARFHGEPLSPSLALMWRFGTLAPLVRRGAVKMLAAMGEHRFAGALSVAGRKPVEALWRLVARRDALRERIEAAWHNADLDAVVGPASATPAVPIGMEGDASLIFSYFGRYNTLGMPAGVVPVTRVQPGETRIGKGRDQVDRRMAAITAQSAGLPVAVQVAAPRWQDHKALAVMMVIEASAQSTKSWPRTPVTPGQRASTLV